MAYGKRRTKEYRRQSKKYSEVLSPRYLAGPGGKVAEEPKKVPRIPVPRTPRAVDKPSPWHRYKRRRAIV